MQTRLVLLVLPFVVFGAVSADDTLIGHWPLTSDGRDVSDNKLHATVHNAEFLAASRGGTAATFNGRDAWLEIPSHELLRRGTSQFTITCWIQVPRSLDDVPGDVLSQYHVEARRGFHLGVKSSAGVTCSQSNDRQLQFGIDNNQAESRWTDRGRPGNALLAFSLCTFDGHLYAATCEPGPNESGHVYRFRNKDEWVDCGSPDESNSVTALAEYRGQLYAGTGKYRLRGSSLTESENTALGGRVFRYAGGQQWTEIGQLPNTEAIGGLVVFKDRLYASSLYRPAGFFRYESDGNWTDCGTPNRPDDLPGDTRQMRVEAMGVFNGWLWASSYDGGRVFRYNGERWEDCGGLDSNTQTYSFAVHHGRLYTGTWPSGEVYRMDHPRQWSSAGRLGQELEVMAMLAHNGRLLAGSLPLAQVYEYDESGSWDLLARLDHTPDVRYRRAWTMAEYNGQVFCSTLPSGRIYSWSAGRVAMSDRSINEQWHHVAAVKSADRLLLYVDGQQIAQSVSFESEQFDLSSDQPLLIGKGPNDFFSGQMSDVRLYGRAWTATEVRNAAR